MSWLSNFLTKSYIRRYSKLNLQRQNSKHIYRALQAYGYNNSGSEEAGGEVYFIREVLRHLDPKVLLDVGANVGNYSRVLLTEFPKAQVFSFEPLKSPFSQLQALSKEFGDRHVAVNCGVGNRDEKLTIHFNSEATTHASFVPEASEVPYVSNQETEELDVVTLDQFFRDRLDGTTIDFIKIDTEGFEAEVLAGASEILAALGPMAIQLEYNWHHMFRGHSLFTLSKALPGYDVFQTVPGGVARRDPRDPLSNLYIFSNFVFVRKDLVAKLEKAGVRF